MVLKSLCLVTGRKRSVTELWQDLFSNTSQWWDHRPEKINLKFPDFKHKQTRESLWLNDERNPSWVQAELAAIPPGTLQSNVFAWAQRLKRLAKLEQYREVMEVFYQMQQEGICPDNWTFLPVLKACAGLRALEEGRRVHTRIIQVGQESDLYVATCLVDMYTKCGSIEDAWSVFNKMPVCNVVTWSTMIAGYAKSGEGLKAVELFWKMQQEGVEPNPVTFVGVLKACASVAALEEGRCIHSQIIQFGCDSDVYVANCLVDMYAKCGSTEDAWCVFNEIRERNVVTWNAMIGGYVKSGQVLNAIELFWKMQQDKAQPNAITFVEVLNACGRLAALEEGRLIHKRIVQVGYEMDVYVATCLVDMYAKCGSIKDACSVFDMMQGHDVITWSAMIGGYVKSGNRQKALELLWKMQQEGVKPDTVIFVQLLNACASAAALGDGRLIHTEILQVGCELDVYLATCLVDMYVRCGSMDDAWDLFNKMEERNVVTWSLVIAGCVKFGQGLKAIELFRDMRQEGVEPDQVAFVGVLKACASVAALEEGRRVHTQIMQAGCESDLYVATCLVDMYAKCGSIEDAWNVFNKIPQHNVVTWNAMILGYVKSGQGLQAMKLFQNMQQKGVVPDAVTFLGVLNACASLADLGEGRRVHALVILSDCDSDVHVANCLVDMYVKCWSIDDAWSVFKKMHERNAVTWNAMIGGYVSSGQGLEAMELFGKMQQEGVEPDAITFIEVLNACASVMALEEGRHVHRQIMHLGFESVVSVANCLVDMYAKCGSIEDAWSVFNKMRERSVVTWNSMIGGYGMHGQAKKAIGLFRQMDREGLEIDVITFICLLSACSHGGLVKEGLRYFELMSSCFNILPTMDHYACMVNLLGRAGQLQEAEELMKKMPFEPDVSVWISLLGAYKLYGNIEMAERAANKCWELDPGSSLGHVLLSNMYATAENRDRSALAEEGLANEV